jgi:hypothetical protein
MQLQQGRAIAISQSEREANGYEREMTCTEQLILKCRSSELEHGRKRFASKPFDWHRRQDSKTEREGFEHQWFPNLSPACS